MYVCNIRESVADTWEVAVEEEEVDPTRFVPYQSALRQFKSYRYHPNYAQDVPSGFLSMTFSHQIDPDRPLCPDQAAGVACSIPDCQFQHFEAMNLTGACVADRPTEGSSLPLLTQADLPV
jgi:hypothetical protein